MPISVVIPSYKSPEYLDLALRSATEQQTSTKNQIIAIIDGFPEMYTDVLSKYKNTNVEILINEENRGQTYCHNTGVMLAEHEQVLVVNDDNVFPPQWDNKLSQVYSEQCVIAPNQVEPTPSIFKAFTIHNFGTTAESFNYDGFVTWADRINDESRRTGLDGQTWPLFMSKKWYMILGGIDANFPSPAVADWDFFLRCELAGLFCCRYFGVQFYHFAGAATKRTPDMAEFHAAKEQQSFEYFAHKWGYWPTMRADTHSKINPTLPVVRGVRFLDDGP